MVSFNNDKSPGDDKSPQNDKLVEKVFDCVPENVLGALFTPKGMDGLVGSGANSAPQGEELFLVLVKAQQAIKEGVTSEKLSEISDLVLQGLKSVCFAFLCDQTGGRRKSGCHLSARSEVQRSTIGTDELRDIGVDDIFEAMQAHVRAVRDRFLIGEW